jgi:predicted dinucleotide-binding enzyme
LPGAKVVKAFNTLLVEWIRENPVQPNGDRVLFISGDDTAAKSTVIRLVESFGFATVDLGNLKSGGLLQQAGKPLAALNLLLVDRI